MLDDAIAEIEQGYRTDPDGRYAEMVEAAARTHAGTQDWQCFDVGDDDTEADDTEADDRRRRTCRARARIMLDAAGVRGLLHDLVEAQRSVRRVRYLADAMERESPNGVGMHLARQLRATLDGTEV